MQDQSLVDANMNRAVLIAQACAYRMDRAGIRSQWTGYNRDEGLVGTLITDTLMQYERPSTVGQRENYTRLFFHNPRLTDIVNVDWGDEVPIEKNVVERYSASIEKVKGVGYNDTIKHTFSKTTSLQQAFKVGAELAIKAYFKASYSGVEGGAEVSAKLTAEYSRQWGEQETHTDEVSRGIELPADYEGTVHYEAVRSVDKVQRAIKSVSNMDYKIEFISGPKPEPIHCTWETLDEFILVGKGFASTTHAMYGEFMDNRLAPDEIAAIEKAGEQSVEFMANYDNVQSQDIRIL